MDPSQVLDESEESEQEQQFTAFAGTGARISGKKVDATVSSSSVASALAKKEAEQKQHDDRKPVIAENGELVYKARLLYSSLSYLCLTFPSQLQKLTNCVSCSASDLRRANRRKWRRRASLLVVPRTASRRSVVLDTA